MGLESARAKDQRDWSWESRAKEAAMSLTLRTREFPLDWGVVSSAQQKLLTEGAVDPLAGELSSFCYERGPE